MPRTPRPALTPHSHKDLFRRYADCPRCQELAAMVEASSPALAMETVGADVPWLGPTPLDDDGMRAALEVLNLAAYAEERAEMVAATPAAPVASIAGMHFRGNGKAADEWGPKPAPAATTKVMCWLCLGNHAVADCPRLEQARRSGDSTTLRLLRSEGLA